MDLRQALVQEVRQDLRIIGMSEAAVSMRDFARRVAAKEYNVLLIGETGTGKDHLAEYIHNLGGFTRPFVPVDCGAIPKELVETELFGYGRGAFTGSIGEKEGLVQTAEGGTLFLNEVGNLSLELQAKFLRIAEGRSFRQVGRTREIRVHARIIAATNTDLAEAVERKVFRSDLYHRLNVITYRVPPLRERLSDIQTLASHFLEQMGEKKVFSNEAVDFMTSYEWPGNVRELQTTMARGTFNANESKEIALGHLEFKSRPPQEKLSVEKLALQIPTGELDWSHVEKLPPYAEAERSYWMELLKRTEGNVTKTAQLARFSQQRARRHLSLSGLGHLIRRVRKE